MHLGAARAVPASGPGRQRFGPCAPNASLGHICSRGSNLLAVDAARRRNSSRASWDQTEARQTRLPETESDFIRRPPYREHLRNVLVRRNLTDRFRLPLERYGIRRN